MNPFELILLWVISAVAFGGAAAFLAASLGADAAHAEMAAAAAALAVAGAGLALLVVWNAGSSE